MRSKSSANTAREKICFGPCADELQQLLLDGRSELGRVQRSDLVLITFLDHEGHGRSRTILDPDTLFDVATIHIVLRDESSARSKSARRTDRLR